MLRKSFVVFAVALLCVVCKCDAQELDQAIAKYCTACGCEAISGIEAQLLAPPISELKQMTQQCNNQQSTEQFLVEYRAKVESGEYADYSNGSIGSEAIMARTAYDAKWRAYRFEASRRPYTRTYSRGRR